MNPKTVVDILLVEDNPLDAELITRAIRKQNVVKPVSSDAFVEGMKNVGLYWLLVNQPPN